MVYREENWHLSRPSRDAFGSLFHEIAMGQVTYLPDIPLNLERNLEIDYEREVLKMEQQQFLHTMAAMEELEGDEPAAFDLRVGKPHGLDSLPGLTIGVVGRVTSRDQGEAEENVQLLWNLLSTAFPQSYGFSNPSPSDKTFLQTILPSFEDLERAHIWELIKDAYAVRLGDRIISTVGTYSDVLDSMIASWNAIARSPERVLLSIRCVPISSAEAKIVKSRIEKQHHIINNFVTNNPHDTLSIRDTQRRLDTILSSIQLLRLRIQVVSWQGDPFAIKAAIKASLTTSLDTQVDGCQCHWSSCNNVDERERAMTEIAHVCARKREDEIQGDVEIVDGYYRFPDHDLVTIAEASAAWRLPLARRYGISGVQFRRDPMFQTELLANFSLEQESLPPIQLEMDQEISSPTMSPDPSIQRNIDKQKRIEIFFCYAREDEVLLQGLEKQLKVLRRQGIIHLWHDREISPGAEWEREIDQHLKTASIILLLISPDFMDSDYCYGVEMKRAMERHERGEALVIPIILRPVYWKKAPFGKLQALPKDAVPVTSSAWHTLDEAFFDIAEKIRVAAEELTAREEAEQLKAQGNMFYTQKRYDEALTAFELVLQLNPNDADAYRYKGLTLNKLKFYVEALVAFEQALQYHPNDANIYNNLGLVLVQLKRPTEAQAAFAKAKQLGFRA
jgi:tetratricopeptide (TPR) repeat protein